MSQSRSGSLVESVANVAIGYGVAVATQMAVLPMFGMVGQTQDHLAIAGIFSAVSVARSYCVRRAFNWLTRHQSQSPVNYSTASPKRSSSCTRKNAG